MHIVIALTLLVLSACSLQAQSVVTYVTTGNPYPVWTKYTVTKIANGVSGCANANGCWQVNAGAPVAATAGLTQDVVLFQLPAAGHVLSYRIKTATACTGATTILTGLGTASTNTFYLAQTYNLITAVSATNISPALPVNMGSDTASAVNIVASLITTVANVDQIANGCSFAVHVLWSVLP